MPTCEVAGSRETWPPPGNRRRTAALLRAEADRVEGIAGQLRDAITTLTDPTAAEAEVEAARAAAEQRAAAAEARAAAAEERAAEESQWRTEADAAAAEMPHGVTRPATSPEPLNTPSPSGAGRLNGPRICATGAGNPVKDGVRSRAASALAGQ
jgi:hypothetical protein